jgi:hypothetical protein
MLGCVPGRGIDHHDQLGICGSSLRRRLGPPYVFADEQADTHAPDHRCDCFMACAKIALVVEHTIVRQRLFMRRRLDTAVT